MSPGLGDAAGFRLDGRSTQGNPFALGQGFRGGTQIVHPSLNVGTDEEDSVPVQFKGRINVDIRDSEPDWTPFEPPRAPDGAPNVLYVVLSTTSGFPR
jgi:hypothetical protein